MDNDQNEVNEAAIHLRDAGHYMSMAWATRNVATHLSAMWREKADFQISQAAKSLGFRLVPLTEQKEAA